MGPSIDVGSAMTAKILRNTGEVVPQSIIWPLTLEGIENSDLKEHCRKFDEAVIAKIGEPVTKTYLPVKDSNPTYDTYIDDMTE